jgi:glutamate N-acetyltransferase/amino-acid N-acetyltransferase
MTNSSYPLIPGFFFNGLACGIKKNGQKDLGLIFSERPAVEAGVFTQNWVKAAPVILTQRKLEKKMCQAVLVNSGNANACTGKRGMDDARKLASEVAGLLKIPKELVAIASTGIIGEFLPTRKMLSQLPTLCSGMGSEKIAEFAKAIMTTDTKEKIVYRQRKIKGKKIIIAGIAKGSGMINPALATMLGFILTNAAIKPTSLLALLKEGVEETFNQITVDGETSTNDMVLMLANGMAENQPFNKSSSEQTGFKGMLFEVMEELALKILQDGEGVTKVIEIRVEKARNKEEANTIARSIANSPLVKTSFFGEEANWGRIMAAAGKTKYQIVFDKVDLFINQIPIVQKGGILGSKNEKRVQKELTKKSISITLTLHQGNQKASIFTTDLSTDYVRINAGYKS